MRIENQILHNLQVNKLSIDASTVCQLRCPACSTGKGIIRNGIIGAGFLSFENFKMLVDENPSIKEIELSNWGEIFLNPELIKIVEYAYRRHTGTHPADCPYWVEYRLPYPTKNSSRFCKFTSAIPPSMSKKSKFNDG